MNALDPIAASLTARLATGLATGLAARLGRRPVVRLLALALAYFVTGKLGLLLAIPPGYATAIWPASGIALAALLFLGPRYWPGVWLGSFFANITVALAASDGTLPPSEVLTAIAIALGASAEAVLGAILIRRKVGFPVQLVKAREVFAFLTLGGPVACLVNATWGVVFLFATGAIPTSGITYSWWTWWVGDTIGVLIFAPLAIMWLDRSPLWQSRRWVVTLSLAATFTAAVLVFMYASRSEWRALQADFDEDTAQITTAIKRRVELHTENLLSVANFFAASGDIKREDFQRFTRSIVKARGDVMGVGWVPRVLPGERAKVEAQLPVTARRPYIYEMREPLPPAAPRDEHFPVLYFTPRTTVEISGFDLSSEPTRRATLEQARDRGVVTASPGLTMTLVPGRPTDGFLLAQPIYDSDDVATIAARREHLRGYAVGFFRLGEFLGHADVTSIASERVSLVVKDVSAPAPIEIFRYPPTQDEAPARGLQLQSSVQVGGRNWQLLFTPTLEFVTGRSTVIIWLVLAGGLLFSALVGVGALILTGRTTEVEALVRKRTDELATINEKLSLEVCDHIRTEAALKEERTFLEIILDNLNEGVIVFDSKGTMTLTNLGARRTLARVSGRLDDWKHWRHNLSFFAADGTTLLPPDSRPLASALRGETVTDFELVAAIPDRKPIALMLTARPLRNPEDETNGALVFLRDITESRAADRLKREFVSVVSHELRTPLTSIRGSLGLVAAGATGELPPKAQQLVTIAYRNCERLSLLINDILDIEKIESGQLSLAVQVHALAPMVTQAVEANCGYAREYEVEFVIDAQALGDDLYVNADPHRVLQVLSNLLSNAAKFSPPGQKVHIGVRTHGDRARVSIRDNGPGIPPEFQSRIFQKFSQADSSDTRMKRGTGLGLAISKALIERMGGTIGYVTQIERGTTFFFDLPLADADAGELRSERAP